MGVAQAVESVVTVGVHQIVSTQAVRGLSCSVVVLSAVVLLSYDRAVAADAAVQVPTSRRLVADLAAAQQQLEHKRYQRAAQAYQSILARGSRGLGPVQSVVEVEPGLYYPAARVVRQHLVEGPAELREEFAKLVASEAAVLLERAMNARDPSQLEALWRAYPTIPESEKAAEVLAELAFEGGKLAEAKRYYALAGVETSDPRLIELERMGGEQAQQLPLDSWSQIGGEASRGRRGAALGPGRLKQLYEQRLPTWSGSTRWSRLVSAGLGKRAQPGYRVSQIHPVVAEQRVVLATGSDLLCYGLERGDLLWRQRVWTGTDDNFNVLYGASIGGGRVFTSFVSNETRAEYYRGIPIKVAIAKRRLVAVDLQTGKRLWDHASTSDPFLSKASVAAAPVVVGDRLYATAMLRQGALKVSLVCLDAATGALIWRRYLGGGQSEMTMFGEHAIEPLAMATASAAGVVYAVTCTGLVAAVSARTGDLLWLSRYEPIAIRATRSFYAHVRSLTWPNMVPLVAAGVLVVAPLDGQELYGFDVGTGSRRWSWRGNPGDRILGAVAERVIVAGRRSLTHLDIRSGKLVSQGTSALGTAEASGIGLLTQGTLVGDEALVPLGSALHRVQLRGDAKRAEAMPNGRALWGSVVVVGSRVVAATPSHLRVFEVAGDEGQ